MAAGGETDAGKSAGGGRIAYQYVGRVSLNFATGTGVVYGYFTQMDGLPASTSLFRGTPGEANALLTFRADISFQPLPGNGDLGGGQFAVNPAIVKPGEFSVYYSASPNHNWSDPDSFSKGQLAAAFLRAGEQYVLTGPIGINTASATLQTSSRVSVDGVVLDLGKLLPRGVTNITTGSNTPLTGSTPVAPVFAFAGYGLAIGK